ncbi:hypothetical protein ALC53_06561, partial [Atta colombica]
IECIVIDRITGKIPTFSLGRNKFNLPRNIRLADPRFHISSDIDFLIGVDLLWNLICVGQLKSSDKHLTLQKMRLGWILDSTIDRHKSDLISILMRFRFFTLTVDELKLIRDETIQLLKLGAFELTKWAVERWRHVASPENPADTLSRGINPYDLIEAERWRNEFLKWDEEHWPPSVFPRLDNDLPEQRKIRVAESTFHSYIIDDLLNKHSNLNKICRIIAYCLRLSKAHWEHRILTFMSPVETSTALDCICRTVYNSEHFKLTRGFASHDFVCKCIWPISLRSTVREIIQKCVTCFRAKPNQSEALMGSLPASEAFIAAFKRFISRKDRPAHIYSDNGTTFVGAHKQIQELYDMYNDPQVQSEIKNFLRELEISWSFTPSYIFFYLVHVLTRVIEAYN